MDANPGVSMHHLRARARTRVFGYALVPARGGATPSSHIVPCSARWGLEGMVVSHTVCGSLATPEEREARWQSPRRWGSWKSGAVAGCSRNSGPGFDPMVLTGGAWPTRVRWDGALLAISGACLRMSWYGRSPADGKGAQVCASSWLDHHGISNYGMAPGTQGVTYLQVDRLVRRVALPMGARTGTPRGLARQVCWGRAR